MATAAVAARPPREMSFDGNLGASWEFFIQKFEIYLLAARLDKETEEYKAVVFLNTVGDGVIKIYNNLEFQAAGDRQKYSVITQKLNEYFIPAKNVTFERNVFFTRNMRSEETIDEYCNDLRSVIQIASVVHTIKPNVKTVSVKKKLVSAIAVEETIQGIGLSVQQKM
ncbi:unnamed protein product [Phaedon cochleariae]|uniref:Retrotransposon gag domain-containing protein n=1 Tax=Phaedon cochleariae TaxID=80249 RepID=A0A9N9SIF9_PHACE|nr:unnamed protein product [Phaedon cochleariae]